MCKIIAFTNVTKVKDMKRLTALASRLVGSSETDGFGYTIQTETDFYGERSTETHIFNPNMERKMNRFPYIKSTYNRFGELAKPIGAAMFHGRTSTNSKSLENTHPINKHGWSLIHNGVVTNHGPKYETITTNDSEHVVELMATKGISSIEEHLTGYYAFAAIDPDGNFHIVKDAVASLYVAEIEFLDSWIFATKESHIIDLCKTMKWKVSVPQPMKDSMHIVFKSGQLISAADIKPRGYTMIEASHSEASLGYEFDNDGTLDEDEEMFLAELQYADTSYTFFNYKNEEIDLKEFNAMNDDEKLSCKVIRFDGTIVNQENYEYSPLYGAV